MKAIKFLIGICYLLLLLNPQGFAEELAKKGLKVSSPAFQNNTNIPSKYTCDGLNINPPLKIENIPKETKSLAIVFDDIDAPKGSYVHWILWNINPNIKEIKENLIPEGAIVGLNGFKKNNYSGPCPPRRAHRYVFRIYALDTHLQIDRSSTKSELEKAMEGHIIDRVELMGIYKRMINSKK